MTARQDKEKSNYLHRKSKTVLPLQEASKAQELSKTGYSGGKIVLKEGVTSFSVSG